VPNSSDRGRYAERVLRGLDDAGNEEHVVFWIERKAGARGLRSILEHIMLDVMYEIPSQSNIRKCIVTEEVVRGRGSIQPEIVEGIVEGVEGKKAELA